jgi:dTDP-4-dehydrorhamnose reductase
MEKILVTGSGGQLGQSFASLEKQFRHPLILTDRTSFDLLKPKEISEVLDREKPTVVINCAGFTEVDLAEENRRSATALNADAVEKLGRQCKRRSIFLIHFSTDYVFDGNKSTPYVETDSPHPLNVYGETKLEGEKRLIDYQIPSAVIRTSWLFSAYGKNFLKTIVRRAMVGGELKIVGDQRGSPTYAADIASMVLGNIETLKQSNHCEIFHWAGSDVMSWFEFAERILERARLKVPLKAISSTDYASKAVRPAFSALSSQNLSVRLKIAPPSSLGGIDQVLESLRAG